MAEGVEDPRAQAAANTSAAEVSLWRRRIYGYANSIAIRMQPLEIYGPFGTRAYVRTGLQYTHTLLGSPYVVHELRTATDPPPSADSCALPPDRAELPTGRNIAPHADGTWPDIWVSDALRVSAAPILHSVPCVGFVVHEQPVPGKMNPALYTPHLKRTGTPMSVLRQLQLGDTVQLADGTVLTGPERRPGRKIVILGDTYDPSPIAALAQDADVLVHEATNAHLPGIDPNTKATDTYEVVEERSKSRGHSTPQMAGAFAKRIGAKRLVLNHFSARYAGDDDVDDEARKVMQAIRQLAAGEFGVDKELVCARDLMTVEIEPRK